MTRIIGRSVSNGTAAMIVALGVGALVGAAPAWAHVHANSPGAVRGSMAVVTFEVPNESQTGSATTGLTITLPDVASARTETKPGWTAKLDRDATGAIRSVTWTAGPDAGIGVDQFGVFRMSMKLPDVETVRFPAAQRYADGTVVNWDQPPLPGGGEPDRPAPALNLIAGPAAPPEHHSHTQHPLPAVTADAQPGAPETQRAPAPAAAADNPARILAGVALLLAALAVTAALTRRKA